MDKQMQNLAKLYLAIQNTYETMGVWDEDENCDLVWHGKFPPLPEKLENNLCYLTHEIEEFFSENGKTIVLTKNGIAIKNKAK